jgi:hypothetical protein
MGGELQTLQVLPAVVLRPGVLVRAAPLLSATWEVAVIYEARLSPGDAGFRSGCLTGGPVPVLLRPDAILAVGFGWVEVTLDGQVLCRLDDECVTLADLESIAARYADHDWRVLYYGPLSDELYQRQADGWALICKGRGFFDDDGVD